MKSKIAAISSSIYYWEDTDNWYLILSIIWKRIYLRRHTENVCIILYETTNSGQSSQRSRGFITMNDTEFCHSDREFLVTSVTAIKYQAMTRTVHWFQSPFLLLYVESKHVVFIVLPVSRGFPKLAVIHVWWNNCVRWAMYFRLHQYGIDKPSWYPRFEYSD